MRASGYKPPRNTATFAGTIQFALLVALRVAGLGFTSEAEAMPSP
jgi:hypothetical protein